MKTIKIKPQPTESTCGPTCLQAVYSFYGKPVSIEEIIRDVPKLEEGGTLAVMLGIDALKRGFKAEIISFNLQVFDPTWFHPKKLDKEQLIQKLQSRAKGKRGKVATACKAYVHYLQLGGKINMEDLSTALLKKSLKKGTPLLTGLSSTYLYHSSRVAFASEDKWEENDILGDPEGHFVILERYNQEDKTVTVVDPYSTNPYSKNLKYNLPTERILNAILLGVLTYDANLLSIS